MLRFAFLPVEEGGVQQAAEFLVGVHGENPFIGCLLRRKILLLRIVRPGTGENRRTVFLGDLGCAVGASGVHNHDFVGHIARGITAHYLHAYCARPETAVPAGQKLAAADLQRVQDLIESHLDAKPCLEELANALGLSVASFCRRFKNSTGLPPYQYLLHARVARAKQALLRRTTSLSELALSLGFYDQSQFSNTFRKIVGLSPRDYRRAQSS